MHALFSGLRDRNPTVRKQFSSAISYLLKFCSSGQVDALLKFVKEKLEGDQGALDVRYCCALFR